MSDFKVLQIAQIGGVVDPLYPKPGSQKDTLVTDEADGDVARLVADSVKVSDGGTQLAAIRETRIAIYVTDSRLALVCAEWTRGNTWVGTGIAGLTAASVMTGINRMKAAKQRKGTTLVGQVRYEWLMLVGYAPRSGIGTTDRLTLTFRDPTTPSSRYLNLTLTLPKGTRVKELCLDIVRRAAQRKLAIGGVSDADRAFLEQQLSGEPAPLSLDSPLTYYGLTVE